MPLALRERHEVKRRASKKRLDQRVGKRRKTMPEDTVKNSAGDAVWAQLRFGVIGHLLAAPPSAGALGEELDRLASKNWRHPKSGAWVQFGRSTIERWYYRALAEPRDPVGVLSRKVRKDRGEHPGLSVELRSALQEQYRQHSDWSYQLQADNLAAWIQQHPGVGAMPSYVTVRRYLQSTGLIKRRRLGRGHTAGVIAAEKRFENLEVRSYESEYVNALWHLDFHAGSLKVLLSAGRWSWPQLLGILDDHSRLCCHAQWYLSETAEVLVHGTRQAFEKRALPRAIMSDNGSAMKSDEFTQGLGRLGIVHERTLPYSAYQNGKQEVFWAQVEGRLLAMLSGCPDLTLPQLNEATQAWVEMEYNRKVHSETRSKPVERYVTDKDVGRPCPSNDELLKAFTAEVRRHQRRSDGTVSIEGGRFEVPSRYRHLIRIGFRYAAWDLSQVYLADERTGQILCRVYPLDKNRNADAHRRSKEPVGNGAGPVVEPGGMAPLLRKLIADYAVTGLPPAYLPKNENKSNRSKETHE
jgi:transposase InsO family protein